MTIASLVVFCASVAFLCITWNKIMDRKYKIIFSVVIILALAFLGASIMPKSIYDLSRHYEELDAIRDSDIGFIKYVTGKSGIGNDNYRYSFVFNMLRYFIANNLPNPALPFIAILVCYGILFYIMLSYFKDKNMKNNMFVFALAFSLSLMPYLYVYSGIRNAMGAAIAALAIYLYLYKKVKVIFFIILVLVASTFHIVTLVVVVYAVLSRIKRLWVSLVVAVGLPFAIDFLMVWSKENVPGGFIGSITYKYYHYMYGDNVYQGKTFFVVPLVLGIIVVLFAIFLYKKYKDTDEKRIITFIMMYSIFAIVSFRSYQISVRLPYVLACLTPVIMGSLINQEKFDGKTKALPVLGKIGILGIGLLSVYTNCMWLV